jgi:hypothetical protein
MEFSTAHDYPAGLDVLWDAFGQPAYPRQKYLTLGATSVSVDRFVADSQTIEVEVERVVPIVAGRVPAWARRLVGREQMLRQRTRWRRASAGRVEARLQIVPVGLPVQAQGTGSIVELDAGTSRMTLVWRVESSLPVLGGRVERLFADQVRASLDADHAFTVAFLQQAMTAHGRGGPRPPID